MLLGGSCHRGMVLGQNSDLGPSCSTTIPVFSFRSCIRTLAEFSVMSMLGEKDPGMS